MDENDYVWIDCPKCSKPVLVSKGKKATAFHVECGTTFIVIENSDKLSDGDGTTDMS